MLLLWQEMIHKEEVQEARGKNEVLEASLKVVVYDSDNDTSDVLMINRMQAA